MSSDSDRSRGSSKHKWSGPKHDGTNNELYYKLLRPFLRLFGGPGKSESEGIDGFPTDPTKDDLIYYQEPQPMFTITS
jgi:hypothetical protein